MLPVRYKACMEEEDSRSLLLDIRKDALQYWEVRRLTYNGLLTLAALAGYKSLQALSPAFDDPIGLYPFEIAAAFVFAGIGANALYCFAYVPDLFMQLSDMREWWRRSRWILFALGCLLGMGLAFVGGLAIADMQRLMTIQSPL